MKRSTKLSFLALGAFLVLAAGSIGSSVEVQQVQAGVLDDCPEKTVQEMVDGFMGSPSWEAIAADDGKTYVNVEGDIEYLEKPVRALLQFLVEGEQFEFNALEFNGVPQIELVAWALLATMCEE